MPTKKRRNLKRDIFIEKFIRGWTSYYFSPKLLWRNPFCRKFKRFGGIQSCVPKGRVKKFPVEIKCFKNPIFSLLHSKGA
jgi:hypothetical protein